MKRLIAYCLLASFFSLGVVKADKLYVFVPSDMRAKVLQDKITSLCKDAEVTVFGRVKDFTKRVKSEPPHAIIALSPVIESNPSFKKLLQGVNDEGTIKEPYLLVAVDQAVDAASLGNKKIGVVDILGRKSMKKYLADNLSPDVKMKSVTKVEDLLPLLTFKAVDAIFVSESIFEKLKEKTELNLQVTKLEATVGLVSTALANEQARAKFTECVNAFSADINAAMGVEKWKNL
ncbi:MAG: hypothetical protein AAGB12_00890 [Pseudomonadota bacterium]